MPDSVEKQLEQLEHSIAVLEAQRDVLGEAVVEPALAGLRSQIAALGARQPAESAAPDKRRLLTVLFSDVVGSTAMEAALDPEQVADIMHGALAFMTASIAKYNGMLADLMGDAILAFFGAPDTREDDAERAVRAGLDIQGAARAYAQRLRQDSHIDFNVRVGINTGLALLTLVGDRTRSVYTAMGDTTNVASRLQSAAPPGAVLISHETFRQVRGIFEVSPQPPLFVKGKDDPIQTYLVQRANPRPFRATTRGVAGIQTRTIGRDKEMDRLRTACLDAHSQRRKVWAQLISEPGVGKSRLMDEMSDWMGLRQESSYLFRARAYAGDSGQPFALVRRMWFDRFQIAEDAPPEQAESRWVAGFQELAGTLDVEPAQALGLLIGLPFDGSPQIGAMRDDPTQLKGRAFVVSRELLKKLRDRHPIDILLEDLHWADESSWEYLREVILDSVPAEANNGAFVLATARPEWGPPAELRRFPQYVQLDLSPLSEQGSRELAQELLAGVQGIPPQLVQMLIERSEGVPYYAEELVNWFIDRGIVDRSSEPWRFIPSRLQEAPLPMTLHHLLLTRLSLLSDGERSCLQRGAIFGRSFWEGGITAMGVRQPDVTLNGLQARGFVEMRPESSLGGEREWGFRHALLRDATYSSVLVRERAALHRAARDWLEAQARRTGRLDEFAGLLGEHSEQAGEKAAAADWYLRAGERAKAQGAMLEAKKLCARALELLPTTAPQAKWRALLAMEEVLAVLGEKEASQAQANALVTLARDRGDDRGLAEALMRQSIGLNRAADYSSELPVVDEALVVAERAGDRLLQARALSERVFVLTRLGELESARVVAAEALARARELGDAATLAQVLVSAALRFVFLGEWAELVVMYGEATGLWRQLGDRYNEALVLSNLGYAYIQLGLYPEACTSLEQARALTEAIGARRIHAYTLQNLGLAYLRGGSIVPAREALEASSGELEAVGDAQGRATSLLYLGYEEERSGDLASASRRYAEAGEIFSGLTVQGNTNDALAGLARCSLAQGDLVGARERATELAHYLDEHGSAGMDAPIRAYHTCAVVFATFTGPLLSNPTLTAPGLFPPPADQSAVEARELERKAINAGYSDLIAQANKISNADWRRSFLDNVEENRALIEHRERLKNS